jgi:hypothetical protein
VHANQLSNHFPDIDATPALPQNMEKGQTPQVRGIPSQTRLEADHTTRWARSIM